MLQFPPKENAWVRELLDLAAELPSGLNDSYASEKMALERYEFEAALAASDYAGALTEAADAAYYAVKHLDWIARQLSAHSGAEVTVDTVMQLALAKYALRSQPGNPKDDAAERAACLEVVG